MAEAKLNEQSFVETHQNEWRRLTALCDKAESSLSSIGTQELKEFVRLYRRASTDLALCRTKSVNAPLVDYLNDLTGRAYGILYREPRKPILAGILNAIELSAQTVRRRKVFVLISFVLLFGSAFLAFGMSRVSPQWREALLPAGHEEMFKQWRSGEHTARTGSDSAMMTGFYASNNPRVSLIAGSVGAGTFGFLSLIMLVQNGSLIGILAGELAPLGKLGFLLSSISPHGVPELSGIIVSGSAGLLLGYALICPGRRSRGDALKAVGKDAIVLLATSVVLMFIAAPIEGFFSFNPLVPSWLKVVVASISLMVWLFFWTSFGRLDSESTPDRA